MEPSIILYWKNSKWVRCRRIFYTEGEVTEWYHKSRWRIDGLSVVKPLTSENQTTLEVNQNA